MQIEHLLELDFINTSTNVIFASPTGIGKSHLAVALGYAACLRGHSVLFAPAIDVVNRLSAAESNRQLAREVKRYQSPQILLIDELGYMPLELIEGFLIGDQSQADQFPTGLQQCCRLQTQQLCDAWGGVIT